jgi:hypothetical protein
MIIKNIIHHASWVGVYYLDGLYSVFDEVKPFDGEIEAGFYYVETDNFFPFKGAGWYDADLFNYA